MSRQVETGPPRLGRRVETSWGKVANWYHDIVEEKGSYQKDLILPNLLRLMDIQKGQHVLDLACGEGFFSRRFARLGARVISADISKELIAIAKKNNSSVILSEVLPGAGREESDMYSRHPERSEGSKKDRSFRLRQDDKENVLQNDNAKIEFHVASADNIPFVKDGSVDKIAIVLALQNIENVAGVFKECARVLKQSGKLYLVLNHPAFRIPKQSGWGWDEVANRGAYSANREKGETIQYRRVDRYLSELREKIDMHPSRTRTSADETRTDADTATVSFHRPLQYFAKSLKKNGFAITGIEEWSSDRKSEPGPRAEAENRARAEFPLFMFIEATKL